MATQQFKYGGDFTGEVSFDTPVSYTRQSSSVGTGFTKPYISAVSDGFAFGVVGSSGETRGFSFRGNSLPLNSTTTLFINSGGTVVTSSNLVDQLKALPSYNASTPQVLGHDASGNIEWQAP